MELRPTKATRALEVEIQSDRDDEVLSASKGPTSEAEQVSAEATQYAGWMAAWLQVSLLSDWHPAVTSPATKLLLIISPPVDLSLEKEASF